MQVTAEMIAGFTAGSFFRKFFSSIYNCLSVETGAPPSDVEDLAQETLVSVWRCRARFRGESGLLTWVLAIARNKARDYRRRKARAGAATAAARELADLDTRPVTESALESDEMRREVRRALSALPEELRALLIRRYFEGQGVRAIAEELGEGEKTLEARLHRAREQLRAELMKGGDHVEG
jgi:RNA polymerase sigma-70 factor (ECF subfamily)